MSKQKSQTKNDIKRKIYPSKLGIGIENIKNIRERGIAISCSNADSKEKLKSKVQEEIGNKYEVVDGEIKNPTITIVRAEVIVYRKV